MLISVRSLIVQTSTEVNVSLVLIGDENYTFVWHLHFECIVSGGPNFN
jgi:hypothetical protein